MLYSPYFSHNFCNDVHVSLGVMSKTLPNKGIPRGCGIGVVIAVSNTKSICAEGALKKGRLALRREGIVAPSRVCNVALQAFPPFGLVR